MPNLKGKTILLIGAGPTRIGQGGECDQGAVEACEILKEMGCRVVTVDANPDAVLTEKGIGHRRYVEPLTPASLRQIIAAEKPDGVLTLFAGRSGPYLAEQLGGTPAADPIPLWGTPPQSLQRVQDRDGLKSVLSAIQLKTPTIFSTTDMEAVAAKAQELGFPVVLRCDDAELMADGVLVYNQEELSQRAAAVAAEPQAVISVEESLWQWRQVELEILRDSQGQTVVAGVVEYLDCAGIHPGDAIGVTPAQTIPPALNEQLESQARAIAGHLGIAGNATIRFAYDPKTSSILVTAVHPRYTRTSAFVSQITAIPLAGLATLLAAGLTWKQLPKTLPKPAGKAPDPAVVAVKWPVWDFKRLGEIPDRLGPQMQAVGQSLGIGLTFADAIQKAMRGANPGTHGFSRPADDQGLSMDELLQHLSTPTSQRPFFLYEALTKGATMAVLADQANIAPWFIDQMEKLVALEGQLRNHIGQLPPDDLLRQAKAAGFSDGCLAQILSIGPDAIVQRRSQMALRARWLAVPGPGMDEGSLRFAAYVDGHPLEKAITGKSDPAVLIIGSGPTRIGVGSECDHAAFQAALAAHEAGFNPLILNCNLTGATMGRAMTGRAGVLVDALNDETVQAVIDQLNPMGIITQFAGSQSIDAFPDLKRLGMRMLGAVPETLATLSDRGALWQHVRGLGIPLPAAAVAESNVEAMQKASEIGFPILLRPAVPRGAKASQLIQSKEMLDEFLSDIEISSGSPLFVERFLEYAIEAQAEVLSDGESAVTVAVLEQIELAGVHAGDSAYVLPPYSIGPRHVETITEYAAKVALSLKVKGALNLRFALYRDSVYLLDAADRECRNFAVVTKATGTPVAALVTRIQLGQKVRELLPAPAHPAQFSVRAAVFPFNVFAELDPLLGPSMHSTGEVLAMADSFGMAYFKALEAADTPLPTQGGVLITVTEEDKPSILEPARIFSEQEFHLLATRGTQTFLADNGLQAEMVRKLGFGRPNLVDEMKNGRVQMVINTPTGDQGHKDGGYIRKAAIHRRIANITTPAGAIAAAKGIAARRQGAAGVKALGD